MYLCIPNLITMSLSIILLIVLVLFKLKSSDAFIFLILKKVNHLSHLIFISRKAFVFCIINY